MNSLNERLHELVDGEAASAPPIERLIRRGQRGRRHRRATTLALSALVVGALGVSAAATQPQQPSARPQAEARADPRMELIAALASSDKTSFKLRATTGREDGPDQRAIIVTEGAFDPAASTGQLRTTHVDGAAADIEVRLIEGVMFRKGLEPDRGGGAWVQLPGRRDTLGFVMPMPGGDLNDVLDQDQLLDELRRADAVVTKLGERTYRYEFSRDGQTMSGDIVLDGDRRVSKVTYVLRVSDGAVLGTATLEFWDYGTPVRPERP